MTSHRTTPPVTRRPLSILLTLASTSVLLLAGLFSAVTSVAYASPQASLATLPGSAPHWTAGARLLGPHAASDQLTIGMMLKTTHVAEQQDLIKALYHENSAQYHQWLSPQEFSARFAPDVSTVAAARQFLTNSGGLTLQASPDATLLLASGATRQIEAAFHTTINDYRLADGTVSYANASDVQLPSSMSASVLGVFGLNGLSAWQSNAMPDRGTGPNALPPPYGGGPYGRGLTPSQIAGIYNATPVYSRLGNRGQGVTTAVYELSGYKKSDILVYKKQFGLPNVPIVDRNVLGGPIPIAGSRDYGAGEVELDIQLQIALAPGIRQLIVYNAPNSELGALTEYLQIAKDNRADSISSSWGIPCEYGVNSQVTLAENQIFLQLAAQGQSLFVAAGDAGAYGCTRVGVSLPPSLGLQIGDPNNQPYNTAVGGTSFATPQRKVVFDPGKNPNPSYPGTSKEYTWIRLPCTASACPSGGGGGGVSRIWAEPDYAFDYTNTGNPRPGVLEAKYSQVGAYCGQQPGVLCRENPDISLNSNPTTGYAIYCSDKGDAGCASPNFDINGWIRFGGTSCAAPLWAAINALLIRQVHGRTGLLNYYLYAFDSTAGYKSQLHDITLANNGYYPALPAYDMATGLGTPDIYHVVRP